MSNIELKSNFVCTPLQMTWKQKIQKITHLGRNIIFQTVIIVFPCQLSFRCIAPTCSDLQSEQSSCWTWWHSPPSPLVSNAKKRSNGLVVGDQYLKDGGGVVSSTTNVSSLFFSWYVSANGQLVVWIPEIPENERDCWLLISCTLESQTTNLPLLECCRVVLPFVPSQFDSERAIV